MGFSVKEFYCCGKLKSVSLDLTPADECRSMSSTASQTAPQCADACRACAEECEKHNNEMCKKCAEECRKCEAECRKIAA